MPIILTINLEKNPIDNGHTPIKQITPNKTDIAEPLRVFVLLI